MSSIYFLENKYSKWYFSIIEKVKTENRNKGNGIYYEEHHIIPKSFIKNDDTVLLTAKEHFICHLLLIRFTEGNNKKKMLRAVLHMKMAAYKDKGYKNSSLWFSILREKIGKAQSERMKEIWANLSIEEKQRRTQAMIIAAKTPESLKKLSMVLVGRKRPEMVGQSNPMNIPGVRERENLTANHWSKRGFSPWNKGKNFNADR